LTYIIIYDKIFTTKDRGALNEDYLTLQRRRGCGRKALVPKRMQWRASLAGNADNIRLAVA
jgi:hypothetical protein